MLILSSFLLSSGLLYLLSKFFEIKNKFIIFLISYIVIIVIYKSYDMYLSYNLNSFDLDGDGIFGKEEICKEQEDAMNKIVNDTGSTFIWFSGLIYSFIYVFLYTLSMKIYKSIG